MLITHLGKARLGLLASFEAWTDEQLNQRHDARGWSAAQILHHIAAVEQGLAADILDALDSRGGKVPELDPDALSPAISQFEGDEPPRIDFLTGAALIQQLEESRFRHLQRVFNETHERELAERSAPHPLYGRISLKNLVDLVWLHDRRGIQRIDGIRAAWDPSGEPARSIQDIS